MSKRYPGGVVSATAPTTSTTSATGIWTEQSMFQAVGAGVWPGKPGAPTIGTATAGNTTASVAFTAPTSPGGSPITIYTVTSSPGSITATGASSPITVSGLTNGTAYTFTVTATNSQGTGPASSASNSVTPVAPNVIEDVFSAYLYTGNGTTQTITNGIDLSTKGGLVWVKGRNETYYHRLASSPGPTLPNYLASNATDAASSGNGNISAFTTTGFTVNNNSGTGGTNSSGINYVGWTFRKQPKFFDVVTYTGNGGTEQQIAHNLQAYPGLIIVKRTNSTGDWYVCPTDYSGWNNGYILLNTTAAWVSAADTWQGTSGTSTTTFGVKSGTTVNISGATYVAYVFACSGSGGFGASGTSDVISTGTYTGNGSTTGPTITLGFEPQYVLIKRIDSTGNWFIYDTMRGFCQTADAELYANLTSAEGSGFDAVTPTATGFQLQTSNSGLNASAAKYLYMAIRRGPMTVPTSGTSVFGVTLTENASAPYASSAFPVDLGLVGYTSGGGYYTADRLRGALELVPSSTAAESAAAAYKFDYQNGWLGGAFGANLFYTFKRAPSYFDEVCYTGTGANRTINHNLSAVPELIIVKSRSNAYAWRVYNSTIGVSNFLTLNATDASSTDSGGAFWNGTSPTSTVFSVGTQLGVNGSALTYVAYLFATCAGVSKVGTYTGTGALQTINCGFTGGARFVLIKRTDSTGDWYVYDSSRGLTSGNDPYFLLNSSAAQVTGTNYVDTTSVGFQVTAAAPAGLNASGGTYIFLAIA